MLFCTFLTVLAFVNFVFFAYSNERKCLQIYKYKNCDVFVPFNRA